MRPQAHSHLPRRGSHPPPEGVGNAPGAFPGCPKGAGASQLLGNWIPLLPQRGRQPTVGERPFPEGNKSENINYTDSPAKFTLRYIINITTLYTCTCQNKEYSVHTSFQQDLLVPSCPRPLLANN